MTLNHTKPYLYPLFIVLIQLVSRFTNRVVTLWYRPPELLLGERNYGPPVDIWGIGCIMAEMWTRYPILRGNSEGVQLRLISQLCGSITPEVWPKVMTLELFNVLELAQGLKRQVRIFLYFVVYNLMID